MLFQEARPAGRICHNGLPVLRRKNGARPFPVSVASALRR